MKLSVLFVSALLYCCALGSPALGSEAFFLNMDGDCPGKTCTDKPATPTPNAFPFEKAAVEFQKARTSRIEDLAGHWMQVAFAKLPGFPHRAFTEGFFPEGMKNKDGTNPGLTFSISSGADFFGQSHDSILVSIENLGLDRGDQGPYEVRIEKDNTACFAEYGYDRSGKQSNEINHYNYECRTITASKMLCANRLVFDDLRRAGQEFDKEIVYYIGYTKN
ncbi:MAG: hypothetical protein HYW49_02600 [Deltaproteobacteria bacterium]|nr:hypothetical protein [Deltaproteobacteria bacterium]